MRTKDYNLIYGGLTTPGKMNKFHDGFGYSRELLLVMYTQKTIREATKRFYTIKDRSEELHKQWLNGTSFIDIARKLRFPPVLTALLILQHEGISRRMYWKYLNDPNLIENKRLRGELKRVGQQDIVYSPSAHEKQHQRGKFSEDKINKWLVAHKLKFRTEYDLRGTHPKTPDFLLDTPINVRGSQVNWIESKANFGDEIEIRKNLRNQLIPYRELFGPGMVIYWFGIIDSAPLVDGILIESKEFLIRWVE